ncbi:DUF456 family protein [bacterium]|nr:DUF456 family protein [bacterium]MBU1675624.1 DUF456 family protein [bacterium]
MLDTLGDIGVWIAFGVWTMLLLCGALMTILGLSGNFIIVGLGLVHALVTGFDPISWQLLLLLLGLAIVGEVVESVLGVVYVARKGATRYGVLGAFLGGLAGAALGSGVVPVIGTVVGSFVGAFAGAVAGEYLRERRTDASVRIGWHAFAGKMLASGFKFALALAMIALLLQRAWPGSA